MIARIGQEVGENYSQRRPLSASGFRYFCLKSPGATTPTRSNRTILCLLKHLFHQATPILEGDIVKSHISQTFQFTTFSVAAFHSLHIQLIKPSLGDKDDAFHASRFPTAQLLRSLGYLEIPDHQGEGNVVIQH